MWGKNKTEAKFKKKKKKVLLSTNLRRLESILFFKCYDAYNIVKIIIQSFKKYNRYSQKLDNKTSL